MCQPTIISEARYPSSMREPPRAGPYWQTLFFALVFSTPFICRPSPAKRAQSKVPHAEAVSILDITFHDPTRFAVSFSTTAREPVTAMTSHGRFWPQGASRTRHGRGPAFSS